MPRLNRSIQLANLLIQFCLLVVVVIYTIETSRLRRQSEEQLGLLRTQDQLGGVPSLILGVVAYDPSQRRWDIENDFTLTTEQKKAAILNLEKAEVKFTATATNVSTRPAQNVQSILYDASTRSFLICEGGREVLSAEAEVYFDFSPPYKAQAEVDQWLESQYGSAADRIKRFLDVRDTYYVALAFQDIAGRTYLLERPFEKDDQGRPLHRPGVLHAPP